MLDLKEIRKDATGVEKRLKGKDPGADLAPIVALDARVREVQQEADSLKAKRNEISKQIGELKRKGEDASSVMEEVSGIGERIRVLDEELRCVEQDLKDKLAVLPNLPDSDIKVAEDPKDNVCLKEWGEKPSFAFAPKNHLELNEKLGLFDFKRGAKLSGTGWPVYRGKGAQLEWALIQYMVSIHLKNGFEQVMVPHCVREEAMYGSGQLPKFASQVFQIHDEDYNLYLIPTSEVSLNGLYGDEIIEENLPIRLFGYTPCFRREAGAAGKGERGLIRVHQFNKVEMFCFATPEESGAIFDQMVNSANEILEGLGLHYRNMLLVTGDMGFSAARTVDVEVYLPGQERYYEVSSVSNCTDFQARRAKIRYRNEEGKPELIHTLNGSGLATSRLMVGLLEANQQADGSVIIPAVLRPFMGGVESIA